MSDFTFEGEGETLAIAIKNAAVQGRSLIKANRDYAEDIRVDIQLTNVEFKDGRYRVIVSVTEHTSIELATGKYTLGILPLATFDASIDNVSEQMAREHEDPLEHEFNTDASLEGPAPQPELTPEEQARLRAEMRENKRAAGIEPEDIPA